MASSLLSKAAGEINSSRQPHNCGRLPRVSAQKRKRMHVLYSGRVQGVGFRYTVKSVATGFEVAGAVRNLADGRVELIAEGAPEELAAFRQAIADSGVGHFVEREDVNWSEAENNFRGLEIVG